MLNFKPIFPLLMVLSLTGGLAACAGSATTESTGEYVDDAVVSGKVRSAIIAEEDLSLFDIDVETFKGVVQLSGFVSTANEKSLAEITASNIDGVSSVKNNLIVK